jgi:hypothetical protein
LLLGPLRDTEGTGVSAVRTVALGAAAAAAFWISTAGLGVAGAAQLDSKSFLGLFLGPAELPSNLVLVQDSRMNGPDRGDAAFRGYGGLYAGMAIWMGAGEDAIWRLVDVRWVFTTDTFARAYIEATLKANAEGQPEIPDVPKVGSDCHVFGGTRFEPTLKKDLTQYYYIFRVGRVVVKIYTAQGPVVKGIILKPEGTGALAEKAAAKIRGRLNSKP